MKTLALLTSDARDLLNIIFQVGRANFPESRLRNRISALQSIGESHLIIKSLELNK